MLATIHHVAGVCPSHLFVMEKVGGGTRVQRKDLARFTGSVAKARWKAQEPFSELYPAIKKGNTRNKHFTFKVIHVNRI